MDLFEHASVCRAATAAKCARFGSAEHALAFGVSLQLQISKFIHSFSE